MLPDFFHFDFWRLQKDQKMLKPGKTPSFVANEPQATRAELGRNPTGGAGEKLTGPRTGR